jgi:hypothetical protein
MLISIIQDAFSAAESLLNSPGCGARSGADYSLGNNDALDDWWMDASGGLILKFGLVTLSA